MTTRDAYDVLHDLNRAGVHIITVHGALRWQCRKDRPIPTDLLAELKHHKAGVIAVLLDVPDGCSVPHICNQLGICHLEIESSACFNAEPKPQRKDVAA